MLNRDVNSLVRHLKLIAQGNNSPSDYAVIMKVVRAVGLAIREKNPKFNIQEFENRIAKS